MVEQRQVLRFAVFIDSFILKNWQILCIEKLQENPLNELVLIIKNDTKQSYKAKKLPIGFRYIERQLRSNSLFQAKDIKTNLSHINCISCVPIKNGISNSFTTTDLEIINSYNLDFALRFGFGIIKGDILTIPKYGIWSFHHGNPRKFRGGPPSFWEFFHGIESNGIILQKLNDQLDAGEILREGNIAIWSHSFTEHSARLFAIGVDFPSWVCNAIRFNNGEIKLKPILIKGKIYKIPSNYQVFTFYLQLTYSKFKFHYQQLFQTEIWNIGIAKDLVDMDGRKEITQINWAPKSNKNEYKADPFWDENHIIYFEKFNYKLNKGSINAITFKDNNWSNEKTIKTDLTHYSYPYYLKDDSKKYLIPENFQANQVQIHEIEEHKIIRSHSILKGKWVDPTLIKHQGIWWLFACPQEFSNEALYLFFSNSLEEEFEAHPLNPIKLDISSARPGGKPFINNLGKLIRPSQNSSKTYGGSIVLNEIIELSKVCYQEEKIDEIFPNKDSKYNLALHTFSYINNQLLIDGKYLTFNFNSFWTQIKRKLKRISTR